jgi:hypothetical protein
MFTGSTALRWGGRESPTRLENITGKFVTDLAPRGGLIGELHSGVVVVPAGSMWARNPIPDYGSFPGAASFDPPCKDEPKECGSAARPVSPPKSYDANALCRCSGEWGPFDMDIVDHVVVPAGLEAGEWVLNFRWDTEESNQVWQSCSDITIGVIGEPPAIGTAHPRAALKSDDGLAAAVVSLPLKPDGQWTSIGGDWTTVPTAGGAMTAPLNEANNNFAILTSPRYTSFDAKFEWRFAPDNPCDHMGTAGFVFGVDSGVGPGHEFWVVDFPQVGQNFGKEAFWITVSKFNGTTSWRHSVKMELLPGPTTTAGIWHTTSISVGEGVLQLTVDGYPMLPMEHGMLKTSGDRLKLPIGYELGHVGFITNNGCGGAPWNKAQFRNLNMTAVGTSDHTATQWSGDEPGHTYHRSPASDHAAICCLTRLGENKGVVGVLDSTLLRSTDGRSWQTTNMTKPWAPPVVWNNGRLESYDVTGSYPFMIRKSYSTDSGTALTCLSPLKCQLTLPATEGVSFSSPRTVHTLTLPAPWNISAPDGSEPYLGLDSATALTVDDDNSSEALLIFAHMHRGPCAPAGFGCGWSTSFAKSMTPWKYESPFGLSYALPWYGITVVFRSTDSGASACLRLSQLKCH